MKSSKPKHRRAADRWLARFHSQRSSSKLARRQRQLANRLARYATIGVYKRAQYLRRELAVRRQRGNASVYAILRELATIPYGLKPRPRRGGAE